MEQDTAKRTNWCYINDTDESQGYAEKNPGTVTYILYEFNFRKTEKRPHLWVVTEIRRAVASGRGQSVGKKSARRICVRCWRQALSPRRQRPHGNRHVLTEPITEGEWRYAHLCTPSEKRNSTHMRKYAVSGIFLPHCLTAPSREAQVTSLCSVNGYTLSEDL